MTKLKSSKSKKSVKRFAPGQDRFSKIFDRNSLEASFANDLKKLGLMAGLQLCIDERYRTNSEMLWRDLSGNGRDFKYCAGTALSGAAANEFSGEQWLRGVTNDLWADEFHRKGGVFTLATWIYLGGQGPNVGLFGTSGGDPKDIGISWFVSRLGYQTLHVFNGTGRTVYNQAASRHCRTKEWTFLAVSFDDAASSEGMTWFQDGSAEVGPGGFNLPSIESATFEPEIGSRGNSNSPLVAKSRMSSFAVWNRRLNADELTDLFAATRESLPGLV